MLISESQKGKVLVNGKLVSISDYTSSLASLFGLNQLKLKTVEGKVQTLWFNEKTLVIKELIPAGLTGTVKKEFFN